MFEEQAEKQSTETKPASNTKLDKLTKPTTNQSEQGPSDGQTPKANKKTHQTGTRVPVKCHSNRRKRQPLENQKAKPNNMANEKKEYQKTERSPSRYHRHHCRNQTCRHLFRWKANLGKKVTNWSRKMSRNSEHA